jgi:hypothetical protein
MKSSLLAIFLAFLFCGSALGIVIDDFSVGELALSGPGDLVTQTGLDPQHVIGGSRYVRITRGPTDLTIGSGNGLNIVQGNDYGYFGISYGADTPLQADFAADGSDRLRLRFQDVETANQASIMWISVSSTLPTTGSAPGPNLHALAGGGIVEIPFTLYSADFHNVNTILMSVSRNLLDFTLTEITTAGPPLSGDFDRNGVVDGGDLAEWQRTYGRSTQGYQSFLSADDNRDGRVNGRDFLAWQRAYGDGASQIAELVSVPETYTAVLLVGAILCCPTCRFARKTPRARPAVAALGGT